jgi:hypothetical protein
MQHQRTHKILTRRFEDSVCKAKKIICDKKECRKKKPRDECEAKTQLLGMIDLTGKCSHVQSFVLLSTSHTAPMHKPVLILETSFFFYGAQAIATS